MSLTLVALSGYARSGKDTVGDYLVTEHGFKRLAFADALKLATYKLNPMLSWDDRYDRPIYFQDHVDAVGWEKAKETGEVRRLLQRMGTEVGRQTFGENFWVDVVRFMIRASHSTRWVVTDCRFPNEAEMVREEGGEVWRITRPGVDAANAHSSESALDEWRFDDHLVNGGSVRDLYSCIERMLRSRSWY